MGLSIDIVDKSIRDRVREVRGKEVIDIIENEEEFSEKNPLLKENKNYVWVDLNQVDFSKCDCSNKCKLKVADNSVDIVKECFDKGLNPEVVHFGCFWYKEGVDRKKLVKDVIENVLEEYFYDFNESYLHEVIFGIELDNLLKEGYIERCENGLFRLRGGIYKDKVELAGLKVFLDFYCCNCLERNKKSVLLNLDEVQYIECNYCGEKNEIDLGQIESPF